MGRANPVVAEDLLDGCQWGGPGHGGEHRVAGPHHAQHGADRAGED